MEKGKIITLCLMLSSVVFAYGEEVYLSALNDHEDKSHEIPIHVDFDATNKLLRIDFKQTLNCSVIVSGTDGIVYQQSLNAKNYQSVRLDLKPYEEGDYEIIFYDKDGNVVDGSFYLKNSYKH